MTDFKNALRRFSQFGGWRLVWQYAKMGVLWSGGKALLHCVLHVQSLKMAYPIITQKVDDFLFLKQYGGVWMDASVYCSGFGNEKLRESWEHIMASELTLFRYFQRGRKEPVGLSTWFFAAIPHQPVVSIVLDMLLAYWKDFDCTMDYYICHLFFGKVFGRFPKVWNNMPRANSNHSILLGAVLAKDYHEADWQDLIDHVSIHKMNYRKVAEVMKNPNSYCNHLMNEGR